MVRPDTIAKSITTACKESGRFPTATSYSTFELDTTGGQSNVRPPVIEVTVIDSIRSRPHNTDFVCYTTDDDGNRTGRIYHALFELSLQIDVWTAEHDEFDPYELGQSVRQTLYRYDDHMIDDPLPDPDDPSTPLGDIDRVAVNEGSVENDLTMTPALRRWRQTVEIWFHEEVRTDLPHITTVETPTPGQSESGSDIQVVFDVTPTEESAADQYT
jgi:hypothetical protein